MMYLKFKRMRRSRSLMRATLLLALGFPMGTLAQTFTTIYSFAGTPDGSNPIGGVFVDATGSVFGTTELGGNGCSVGGNCGTVYKLTPSGRGAYSENVIYNFTAGTDGIGPYSVDLISDAMGNLFGTTLDGGSGSCAHVSCGTAFKLTRNTNGAFTETVLWRFGTGADGALPFAGLIADAAGNFYGTTVAGGNSCGNEGCGTVFKLTPNAAGAYAETVIWKFNGGKDGLAPRGGLLIDKGGNIYGTTVAGGTGSGCSNFGVGCGIVFKLAPDESGKYSETILWTFTGGSDGGRPNDNLIIDSGGNLYGTAQSSDGPGCTGTGCGVVFKLAPAQSGGFTEIVLYSFKGGLDGGNPYGGVVSDNAGRLYGTTQFGGEGCVIGCGTVFALAPNSNGGYDEAVLHRFTGLSDGSNPVAGLFFDTNGDLFGTTNLGGGNGFGTVFKLATRVTGPLIGELPIYFKVLFGISNDGGGIGWLPGIGIVHVPPRGGDRFMGVVEDHLGNLVKAVELHEQANAGADNGRNAAAVKQRAAALKASIRALKQMESSLKEEESKLR